MTLRTSVGVWRATFFATLGMAPLMACSSSTSSDVGGKPDAGTGGSATGGATSSSGGGTATGGSHTGGAAGGGTGGASGGGGVAGGSTDSGTGGVDAGPTACKNPQPQVGPDGKPTGFVNCDGGFGHRVAQHECGSSLPRATQCGTGPVGDAAVALGQCNTDSDCKDGPNGYCALSGGPLVQGCFCNYGCKTDADCGGVPTDGGAGQICACGPFIGQCMPSQGCAVDADCGSGLLCMSSYDSGGCGATFGCQSTKDTCLTSADCAGDANSPVCILNGDHHECAPQHICSTGRPFLVGGAARVARLASDGAWSSDLCPEIGTLDASVREELAARWSEIALMEHASIAAFARFSLELLSLGAPPSLVGDTQAAMADETVHARDAFALASAYAGRPRGPGRLDVDRALSTSSPLELLRTAILEGCIGETVAAVEAAEALSHATDPAVRAALARVAPDETRHAELAWRFVQWMLTDGPAEHRAAAARTLLEVVESESAAVAKASSIDTAVRAREAVLLAHGVLGDGARAELRRRVMRDVITPCARALVSGTRVREDVQLAVAWSEVGRD